MKVTRFFTAPYILITAFLLLLISGEHWGGFYLLYLLLALPHAGIHSLLAFAGVVCLIATHRFSSWKRNGSLRLIGAIAGVALLAGSLITFFRNDHSGYNDGTFEQTAPLATFIIAGCLAFLYILLNILELLKMQKPNSDLAADGS